MSDSHQRARSGLVCRPTGRCTSAPADHWRSSRSARPRWRERRGTNRHARSRSSAGRVSKRSWAYLGTVARPKQGGQSDTATQRSFTRANPCPEHVPGFGRRDPCALKTPDRYVLLAPRSVPTTRRMARKRTFKGVFRGLPSITEFRCRALSIAQSKKRSVLASGGPWSGGANQTRPYDDLTSKAATSCRASMTSCRFESPRSAPNGCAC